MLKGSIVALITPFKDNILEEDVYSNLINYHIENGLGNFEEDVFSAKETPKTLDKIVKNYQDEKIDTAMVDKQNSKDVDYSKSIKFVND